jgi:hypothetical protein
MPNLTEEQNKALDEFNQISGVLAIPAVGRPLSEARKWILPCPDEKAFADYPEPKEKQYEWLNKWTSCNKLGIEARKVTQSGGATEKKGR